MYFPVAQINLDISIIALTGFVAGSLSGLFGIGGGIISTPVLVHLGVDSPFAIAASAHQIIGSSCTGLYARVGKSFESLDIKLGTILAFFSIIGSQIGVRMLEVISKYGNSQVFLAFSYLIILGTVGTLICLEVWKEWNDAIRAFELKYANKRVNITEKILEILPLTIFFPVSNVKISLIALGVLGVFSGMLVSLMGIGGGFITVPILYYVFKIKQENAVTVSLYQLFIVTTQITFVYIFSKEYLDILLSTTLLIGAVIGGQIGSYIAKQIPAPIQRLGLGTLAFMIAVIFGLDIFIEPNNIFEVKNLLK
jgi:uncharacterized membrane protein YfcA